MNIRLPGKGILCPLKCASSSSGCWLVLTLLVLSLSGCALHTARPTTLDLHPKNGHDKSMVLIRLLTKIDGQDQPALPSSYSFDSIWLGMGDFYSGGNLEVAPLRFFSRQARLDGWAYLLLEPGMYYFAPHPPQNENVFDYDQSWRQTKPCWSIEIPPNVPVIYAGTLFVPGKGTWLMFGGRRLRSFDPARFEIRNETAAAQAMHETWLKDLGIMTTLLMQPFSASEPVILETPRDR